MAVGTHVSNAWPFCGDFSNVYLQVLTDAPYISKWCTRYGDPQNAPPWLAHFAEVEVDTETGQARAVKIVAAHDVGKAINPSIVEGQLEGGLAQGIGFALTEEILYDSKGKQLHDAYHKYMLPTAEDMPVVKAIIVEANDPTGPCGAKGVGETGQVATAPAIANAIYDAIGIRTKILR